MKLMLPKGSTRLGVQISDARDALEKATTSMSYAEQFKSFDTYVNLCQEVGRSIIANAVISTYDTKQLDLEEIIQNETTTNVTKRKLS